MILIWQDVGRLMLIFERTVIRNVKREHFGTAAPTRTSRTYTSLLLVLVLALVVLSEKKSPAQQTIFNVPTTDVLDKGKVYFELDASLKPTDSQTVKSFSSFVPRVVIGAGRRVEMGLNITGNIQPGPDSTTLSPTA